MMRRVIPVFAAALIVAAILLVVRSAKVNAVEGAVNANCFGDLNRTTYSAGFAAADFQTLVAVEIVPGLAGGVQLNTALLPLTTDKIVLPFDQELTAKFVWESAGASHTLGWFYFDQVQPFLDAGGNLVDNDADGIADFFQTKKNPKRDYNGLWAIASG